MGVSDCGSGGDKTDAPQLAAWAASVAAALNNRPVGMSTDRQLWRKVLAADLGLFNAAIFMFALLPPTTLLPQEWLAMILSGAALVGVVAHALPCWRVPMHGCW